MIFWNIALDTSFKEFVEQVRGFRFLDVAHGTPLYKELLKEFNREKQAFLDAEDREERQRVRAIAMGE